MLKPCKPETVFKEFVFQPSEHLNKLLKKILWDTCNPTSDLTQLATPGLSDRFRKSVYGRHKGETEDTGNTGDTADTEETGDTLETGETGESGKGLIDRKCENN